jgi:hypothetical protein
MEGNNASQSLAERLYAAKAAKDLGGLHEILSDIVSGRRMPGQEEVYDISMFIRVLKGDLKHTDTRGWKKSGKITKDAVIILCGRALEEMDLKFVPRNQTREAFGRGMKKLDTGAFPARLRTRGH